MDVGTLTANQGGHEGGGYAGEQEHVPCFERLHRTLPGFSLLRGRKDEGSLMCQRTVN